MQAAGLKASAGRQGELQLNSGGKKDDYSIIKLNIVEKNVKALTERSVY